jgi:hypothetical protein
MARQPLNITPPNTVSRTVLYDADGSVILQIGYDDFMIRNARNELEVHKISSYIRLVDGTQWSPMQMLAKPPVYVGVCAQCRRPPFIGLGRERPSHGIVALNRAKPCVSCGILCCPRHVSKCGDGQFRCKPCSKKHRLKAILYSLFFTYDEG